ncbi:MAG: hypothetical protein JRS35_03275 [Deltaproteobacteria bacterium]|nr:hypothetical protein [Deltaproteobacteria bacterium]
MRTSAQRVAAELLLLGFVVVSVAGVAYLPTHDGPQHIFTTHVANHFDEPGTGWSHWLEPNMPLSSQGFTAIFGPLDALLPWDGAVRVSLALMTLLWALGAFCFVRAVRPERSWLGLPLGAAALQWSLYMGFFSFYTATAFGLFILAYAFRGAPEHPRQRLWLAVLLLLQAFMHVVPAILTGLTVAALLWLRAEPGRRSRELVRIALLGTPAALVAVAVLAMQLGVSGDIPEETEAAFQFGQPPWWTLGKCFLGGPAWRAWPLTFLAAGALLLPLARGLARWRARGSSSLRAEDAALLLTGGGFLLAAAVLPIHLPDWEFFSVRFLPMAVCALVASLPLERVRAPRWRAACAALLALFAFASTGWAYRYNRELAARSRDALAGLDADLTRDGWRLPIVLDPFIGRPFEDSEAAMPFMAPLINLGKLYATAQGGIPSYSFVANRAIHSVVMADDMREKSPPTADPRYTIDLLDPRNAGDQALRRAVTAYLASNATAYQDVILWGGPQDVDYLIALGFEPDWRRAGLAILRFAGCPLVIRFPPGSSLEDDAVLELGWFPASGVTHRYTIGSAQREPDGSLTLPVRQSCGSMWIRFQDAAAVCEGADAEGRLLIPWNRATPEVECRIQSAELAARG